MSDKKPWGKLVGDRKQYDLIEEATRIGRDPNNEIVIDDIRISMEHCLIIRGEKDMKIIDQSSNGTYLNEQKIGKNNEALLKNEDKIHLLFMVPEISRLGFILNVFEQEKMKSGKEKQVSLFDGLDEDLICTICNELVYQCIMLYPCLHNFCGGCVSQWLKKKPQCPNCRVDVISAQKNHMMQNIVNKVLKQNPDKKRNEQELLKLDKQNDIKDQVIKYQHQQKNQFQPIIEPPQILRYGFMPNVGGQQHIAHLFPQLPLFQQQPRQIFQQLDYRDDEEEEEDEVLSPNSELDDEARSQEESEGGGYDEDFDPDEVNRNLVGNQFQFGMPQQWRPQLPAYVQPQQIAGCLSCINEYKGFKCNQGQHDGCGSCGRLMPKRVLTALENAELQMHCQICKVSLCNLYYGNCRYEDRSNRLNAFQNMTVPEALDVRMFRGNNAELQRMQTYMYDHKIECAQIFDYILKDFVEKGLFHFTQNKALYSNPLQVIEFQLLPKTPICRLCNEKVWFQILVRYAMILKYDYQAEIYNREDCHYGVNCRWMYRGDHCAQFNHMCEQTKFN